MQIKAGKDIFLNIHVIFKFHVQDADPDGSVALMAMSVMIVVVRRLAVIVTVVVAAAALCLS